jgi:gliding motility-associated-like protein
LGKGFLLLSNGQDLSGILSRVRDSVIFTCFKKPFNANPYLPIITTVGFFLVLIPIDMAKCIRIQCCLLLFILGSTVTLQAQNEVPNYSFETISACPESFGVNGPGSTLAPPWVVPTVGSADIFNSCNTTGQVDVPSNFFGNQEPITGEGYAGFYCRLNAFEYREYLQAPLLNPLTAGTWYTVSFWVSLADNGCGTPFVGAYLSVTAPTANNFLPLLVTPQVESNQGYLSDTENWTLIAGCFLAEGGESFITLGNFHNDADTPTDPDCSGPYSYYYIEDISVVEGVAPEEFDFDLGGPIYECFSYEIDPGIDGYTYIWEDGSHEPTLVVTESGVYSLTLTDGCNFGIDSIEVIISGNNDPVDLGPEEVTICTGEEYIISLDPDLSTYTWQDGSNDSEYTITTSGIYSVTLDDGCAVSSDQIELTVLDPPAPVTLGDDMFLCLGDEVVYTFDPDLGDFLWQDGSTLPTYTVSGGGMYSLTISNMCGESVANVEYTDLEIPDIDIGPEELTLCTGEFYEIDIDPTLGDIVWQDGSSEPIYEISTPGIYSVFVTNQCGTGSDLIEVFVVDPPVIDLGPDTSLCTGETILLTTTPVNGDYQWQDGSTQQEYVVGSEGIYYLIISNFCGDVIDSVVVDYSSALVDPDFGPDVSLCPGEELILYANNPGAEYLWQDFSTSDSILVTNSGQYSVQVFNDCEIVTDTINVTVNDSPPQLDLPDQLVLCQGATTTLEAGIGGVSYQWSNGSTNPQLVVSAAGTYSLTVSNACGSDRDTVIVIDGGLAPFVDLGSDTSFCAGQIISLAPDNANVDQWLWSDGSTLSTFTITAPGQVSVQVSNGCGTSFDTINATLLAPVPLLNLGPDTLVCPGESVVLTINTPLVDILWSDGSTGPSFSTAGEGIFYASISNVCGTSFDTMEVTFLPDIPALDLGPDQSLCPGEVVSITPGISNVSYLWNDGSTNDFYNATQEETIILIITNECGTATDTLEVFENNQGPQVDLGPDILACEGDIITIPSGISGVSYLWNDGSTNSSFVTSTSGEFILQVSNACGTDADTIVVDIHGTVPIVNLGADTTLCEGVSLVLTSSADAETFVAWQDGSALPSFTVTTDGVYSLYESNHCGEATDTIAVSYIDAPSAFSLGPDTLLCPGESIVLTAPNTLFDLLWQDGSVQAAFVADQQGTYWLQLSNSCGSVADSLLVTVDNLIPVLNLDAAIPWCEGDIITLDAEQPFSASYLWSNGAVSSLIDVSQPSLYSITVTTLCSVVSQEVDVFPADDCIVPEVKDDLFIPNVFSPNSDGINDLFFVSFGPDLNVTSMQGSIYDRWGNLVFSSTEIPFTWDGTFGEKEVLPGVYVYVLQVSHLVNGVIRTEDISGDVSVIR